MSKTIEKGTLWKPHVRTFQFFVYYHFVYRLESLFITIYKYSIYLFLHVKLSTFHHIVLEAVRTVAYD